MREQILKYLLQAVTLYKEITTVHRDRLPRSILDDSRNTIENDIPKHLNNFISIINMVEQVQKYSLIESIQDGIKVFSNPELDISIEKSIKANSIRGYGGGQDTMTAKDILDYSTDAVRGGAELLALQVAAARL
jgi:hypothetical protein